MDIMDIKYIFFDTSNYMYRMYCRAMKDQLDPLQVFKDEIIYTSKSFSGSKSVFAIDCPRHENWRKKLYPEYKGQRSEEDPLFSAYKKECIEWLDNEFLTVGCDHMEADDVIGSLAINYYPCYISTTDNDFYQLLDNDKGVFVLKPNTGGGFTHFTTEQFELQYKIRNCQYIDYKALVGDSADNFKGCKGVGKKHALKILTKYETLDNLYKHLPQAHNEFTAKIYTSLKENREYVYLCKKLATIITDLPVTLE